ncbi:MAG: CbtB-domain containing protein [Gammaproteobacteria bacterium]|nr:CbtB-domain containing protein [Gammaproteobacteria bacterium]
MSSTPNAIKTESHIQSDVTTNTLLPVLFAAVLGATLLWAAGFSSVSPLHNATHDARHSAAFPCH